MAESVFKRFTNRLLEPGNVTDQKVRENRQLADLILNQSTQAQPIRHPLQGAAQLMNALNSQVLRQRANRGEEALKKQRAQEMGSFLENFDPQAASLIQNAPQGQVQNSLMTAAAGQLLEGPDDPKVTTRQLREGDEFVTRRVVNGQPDMSEQGILARSPIDRVSRVEQGGPGSFSDPRTGSQRGSDFQEATDRFRASSELGEQIETIFPRINALPNTVGFRGRAGLLAGGALTAMGSEELAKLATEAISGGDQETISAMQTQLQLIRSRIRPLVTGDEGTRQSESERKIAGDVIGLIESIQGPADLTRAFPQVVGAMKQLYEETWVRRYNEAMQIPQIDVPFDLETDEGVLQFGQRLSDQGFDIDTARQILARLQRIQRGL